MKGQSLSLRLFSYFSPWPHLIFFALLFLLVAKGVEAFVPYYIGKMANRILDGTTDYQTVLHSGLWVLALLGGSFILEGLNVVLKTWMGQKALNNLRRDIYRHTLELPVSYFDRHRVGELMTRTIHDVDQINLMFSESLVPLIGSTFLFFAILAYLAFIDLQVFFVILMIIPCVLVLTHYFRVNQRRCYNAIRKIVGKMNGFVQEHLMGVWTIRSFGLLQKEKQEFEKLNLAHEKANVDTIHYFAAFFSGIDFAQGFALIAVFASLVFLSPEGFSGGAYFSFSLYILMLFRPMADLAERYNVFQSALAAAERIFTLLDVPIETNEGTEELDEIKEILFEDVWFAYKEEDWIFKGLSLLIRKGEKVALVGVTGAGKTTLLKLLLRFYEIQKGRILLNGKPIAFYTLESLRRQFSVVLQDPEIFSGSVAENITFFKQGIDLDKAASEAGLARLVGNLANGFDQVLLERGKSLSQGERQLLSLARAIGQEGSVFVLDEATANIDSESERLIQKALQKIFQERTAIVIAHRLSTIKDLERVVVLYGGRVAEEGSHKELLAKRGVYEKLYRLQFM